MKTIAASLIALGLLSGTAFASSARHMTATEGSSPYGSLQDTAPASPYGSLQDTAPASPYGGLGDNAPRSDGVFGDLQRNAP